MTDYRGFIPCISYIICASKSLDDLARRYEFVLDMIKRYNNNDHILQIHAPNECNKKCEEYVDLKPESSEFYEHVELQHNNEYVDPRTKPQYWEGSQNYQSYQIQQDNVTKIKPVLYCLEHKEGKYSRVSQPNIHDYLEIPDVEPKKFRISYASQPKRPCVRKVHRKMPRYTIVKR
jgi:hypothetical protein